MTNEQLAALDAVSAKAGPTALIGCHCGLMPPHVGDYVATLVDLHRAGQPVVRTEPSEADVERVARAVIASGYNPATAFEIARAAIAAMVR